MRSCWALAALLCIICTTPASASSAAAVVLPLPAGAQPEGVAVGDDGELWVACLSGRILHVDLETNTTTTVHIEHGVALSGAKFCNKQQALFTASSLSGKAYIFHMQRQQQQYRVIQTEVVQLCAAPGLCYINDCAMTDDRVYFTDSFHALLLSMPRFAYQGTTTRPVQRFDTGASFATQLGQFRANGLTVLMSNATVDTLLVGNTHTGNLYTVVIRKAPQAAGLALAAGSGLVAAVGSALRHGSKPVEAAQVTELALPAVKGKVAGHLLLDGLWAVNSSFVYVTDNMNERVFGVQLSGGPSSRLSCAIQLDEFVTPTTLAMARGLLWAVNAHLDTCFPFLPCPVHAFELIGVQPAQACVAWHEQ